MELQSIVQRYRERFVGQFGKRLSTDQWSVLKRLPN